jgi:tetratricopeptide (TPR) repeat protein
MENGTYRECFQRLRLRANITTLAELGDLLAYKSYDYEGSFLSRWQSGKKIPKNRGLHLALLEVFAERDKTLTLSECNRLFELAGLGNLTLDESEQLHLSENQSQLFPSPELWTVPYQRNPYFTGRDEVFAQLEHHFSPLGQTTGQETRRLALTQPHAIKGLGGIGKTQIAVEFAYRSRASGRFKHTFWVNAANEETILASFVELAGILPELSATNVTDQRKLVEAVKRWLEDRQQSWLLIFDNVDNIDNLPALREYLPQRGNGSVLLTTRANAVGSLATSIEVDTMGWREGTDLLLRRAGRFKDLSEEINETYLEEINRAGDIVMALDYFPLALDQAGAYIEETQCTFEDYLALYQTHRQKLLARRGKQATNYPDSVATTWSLSFQKVEQANPAAAQLLHLCAFLAPDRIPEELIKEGAAYWPLELKQSAADFYIYNEVIEELLKFSLVKRQVEDRVLSIHRLVQAVQVDIMEPEVRLQWAERVVRGIDAGFPVNSDELAAWPSCLRYLDQAQTCHTLIEHYEFSFPEAANVLNRIGLYLHDHALYTLSEPLYQRALVIREQLLGEMHPDTATSLNNLASLYESQGSHAEAEPLYRRALAIYEQQLGDKHPTTLVMRDRYAVLLEAMKQDEEVE